MNGGCSVVPEVASDVASEVASEVEAELWDEVEVVGDVGPEVEAEASDDAVVPDVVDVEVVVLPTESVASEVEVEVEVDVAELPGWAVADVVSPPSEEALPEPPGPSEKQLVAVRMKRRAPTSLRTERPHKRHRVRIPGRAQAADTATVSPRVRDGSLASRPSAQSSTSTSARSTRTMLALG